MMTWGRARSCRREGQRLHPLDGGICRRGRKAWSGFPFPKTGVPSGYGFEAKLPQNSTFSSPDRLAQDENGGALPTLYAAVADIPGNSFAGPGGFMEQRGAPKLVGRSAAAQDA